MIPKLFEPLKSLKKPSEGNFYERCQAGHYQHKTTIILRELAGQPRNASAPAIPPHLATKFDMAIYDWREYFTTINGNETVPDFKGYCTGQDIISYCIDQQGVWEGDETLVVLDILAQQTADNSVVLDFGSHIGYYSMLAAQWGYQVASMDNSLENLILLAMSAELNNVTSLVHTYPCWLDKDVPMLQDNAENVQLLKIDVEGAEEWAINMCLSLFTEKKIKYAIVEISPCFNDSYPGLTEMIVAKGYKVYQLPGNNWEHNAEFTESPLQTIYKYCEVKQRGQDLVDHINSFSQENFLFIREEEDN